MVSAKGMGSASGKRLRTRLRALKFWQKTVLALTLLGGLASTLQYLGITPPFARAPADQPTTSGDTESYVSTVAILSEGACEQHKHPKGEHHGMPSAEAYDVAANAIGEKLHDSSQSLDGNDDTPPTYKLYHGKDAYKEAASCEEDTLMAAAAGKRSVDVFVLYNVDADPEHNGHRWKVWARMVDGHRASLGRAESESSVVSLKSCGLGCTDVVGSLARDVGFQLAHKVGWYAAFTVTSRDLLEGNFSAIKDEVSRSLEHYVESDPGTSSDTTHYFFYQTVSGEWTFSARASTASLEKLLRDRKAWGVKLARDGRTLTLERVFPWLRAVVLALMSLLVVVALVVVARAALVVARHHQILVGHDRERESSEGLRHLKNARGHWLVRLTREPSGWRAYEESFKEHQRLLAEARRREVEDARRRKEQADAERAKREDARRRREREDAERAKQDEAARRRREQEDAERAKRENAERAKRDEAAQRRKEQEDIERAKHKARAHIDHAWADDRHPYSTIAVTDELLAELEGLHDLRSHRDELLASRTGTLVGPRLATVAGRTSLELHIGEQINIGGDRGTSSSGILLSYRFISRLGRQCRLEANAGSIGVADQGSTNGTWLDDQEVGPGDFLTVDPKGAVLALGGRRTPPRRGDCRLLLTPTGRRALFACIHEASLEFNFDPVRLRADWPNSQRERNTRWLCLFPDGYADIHLAEDQSFAAEQATTKPLFRLYYGDNGLLVGPPEGAETLVIDRAKVRAPVPWLPGAVVKAENQEYKLRKGRLW